MKRLVLVLLGLMVFSASSYAQQIGPAVPAKNLPGNIATPNLGVGYNFRQAEYGDVNIEEQRAYAHLGAVFGDESTPNYEVYMRLGAASLEADGGYESDAETMYAAGLKGEFYQGETFGLGGVLQCLYVNSFKDSTQVNNQEVEIILKKNWDVEMALPVHIKASNWLFYVGPVFYHAATRVTAEAISQQGNGIHEDHNTGAVGGVALRSERISVDLEAKYRSDFSVGALVTFTF